MKVDLLYFDECPTYKSALENLKEALVEAGVSDEVSMVFVGSEDEALQNDFLGSPTIRVNGVDIEPSARTSKEFGRKCRVYMEGGELSGVPSKELILNAIKETQNGESSVTDSILVSGMSGSDEDLAYGCC